MRGMAEFNFNDYFIDKIKLGSRTVVSVSDACSVKTMSKSDLHHKDFDCAIRNLQDVLAKRSKTKTDLHIKSLAITDKKITISYTTETGAIWEEPSGKIVFTRELKRDEEDKLEDLKTSKGLILSEEEEDAIYAFCQEAYKYAFEDKKTMWDDESLFAEEEEVLDGEE